MPTTASDQLDELLSLPEAADELDMPERDVRELLQDGILAGVNYKLPSATTTSPHPSRGRGLSDHASWIS